MNKQEKKLYQRNIPLMYIFHTLIKRPTMPIIILFFLLNNLNFTQIGILASALAITALILEVPSGVFADLYGRRTALIISSIVGTASMVFYLIGTNFHYFLVATVLFGIAMAFTSGTRSALLYDTLAKLGKENQYKKYNGRSFFYSHIASALILLVIPVIYIINERIPFAIAVVFYAGAFVTTLLMVEPPIEKEIGSSFKSIISSSRNEIKKSRGLFLFILLASLTAAFIYATNEYYQPLLIIAELPVTYFGLVYFGKRLSFAIGAELSHRLEKVLKTGFSILLIGSLIILAYLGSFVGAGAVLIAAVILFSFVESPVKIILGDEVNKRTSSKNRSTVISFGAFIQKMALALLALLYGVLADVIGIQELFGIGIVLFVIVFVTLTFFIFSRKIIH